MAFDIVYIALGPVWAYLSLLFFPVLLGIAPLYAGLAWGNWTPLLFIYGVTFAPAILAFIASPFFDRK